MRNKIALICLFFGICGLVYSYPPMKINDSGVRLRENPGLDGKIIRTLTKGECVTMLSYRLYENDKFRWINVKTNTGEGWVYGEFVSLVEANIPYKFNSIDDVKLPVDKGVIEIGMTKEALVNLLGNPRWVSIDDERKEEWLDFYYKGRLTVVISQINNLVYQLILYTPEQVLINKTKIGIPISMILKYNDITQDSTNLFSMSFANYFKSSEFDCSIILNTDNQGIITRIQIGGSS